MKVLLTGAAGMLGTAMVDHFKGRVELVATDRVLGYAPLGVAWHLQDLLDADALSAWLRQLKPDVVVHCAALVSVDGCEKQPELAHAVHGGTTKTIARTIGEWGARLVYISTDSVFDGQKAGPYAEADQVDPPNVYAKTKLAGEAEALALPGGVVLRTNIFGWSRAEQTSFAEWVVRGLVEREQRTMFTDVVYTPIHVSHLAALTAKVIESELTGLYHASGSTNLAKYDFAVKVAQAFGLSSACVVPTSVDAIGLTARRPKNMALDNTKLCQALAQKVPTVDEGIALLKRQYDSGWLEAIKGRPVASGYRFWEIPT